MEANFDSARFRQVLGHLPTGVVVVTGVDAHGAPSGITIGSFVSVSLDPPLVGFSPAMLHAVGRRLPKGRAFAPMC